MTDFCVIISDSLDLTRKIGKGRYSGPFRDRFTIAGRAEPDGGKAEPRNTVSWHYV